MGALNFISGCISATLVFGGVAAKFDKTTLTIGVIAIGTGFIYEGIGTFLKENSSAYVVAIVGGITVRLLMESWAEEKAKLENSLESLGNTLSRGTDSLFIMVANQHALEREASRTGYQEGYQAALLENQQAQQTRGVLSGSVENRWQEEPIVAH